MNIFLTGSTGFVGTRLVKELLAEEHNLYALVRTEEKAKKVLEKLPPNAKNQITFLYGDITEQGLGLSDEQKERLVDNIDVVYHIAAYLSFDPSEKERTFAINVEGTRNVLEFAKDIKVKKFFHVSTAYTLGTSPFGAEELHPINNTFVNYYEESKCHAEHLAVEYKDVFDLSIFRPAIIIGDSVTGEADTTFALYGILKGLSFLKKRTKRNPELLTKPLRVICSKDNGSNFVSVDYVVKVLHAGLKEAEKNKIYHIVNMNLLTHDMIFDLLKETIGLPNLEMVPLDFDGELGREEKILNDSMEVFHEYFRKDVAFDDTNTKELLARINDSPIYLDEKLLGNIISKYLITTK